MRPSAGQRTAAASGSAGLDPIVALLLGHRWQATLLIGVDVGLSLVDGRHRRIGAALPGPLRRPVLHPHPAACRSWPCRCRASRLRRRREDALASVPIGRASGMSRPTATALAADLVAWISEAEIARSRRCRRPGGYSTYAESRAPAGWSPCATNTCPGPSRHSRRKAARRPAPGDAVRVLRRRRHAPTTRRVVRAARATSSAPTHLADRRSVARASTSASTRGRRWYGNIGRRYRDSRDRRHHRTWRLGCR